MVFNRREIGMKTVNVVEVNKEKVRSYQDISQVEIEMGK